MRRHSTGQGNQLTTAGLGKVEAVEVLQLVFAHVQTDIAAVVQRHELAIAAGNLQLANDEGGSISRVSIDGPERAEACQAEKQCHRCQL